MKVIKIVFIVFCFKLLFLPSFSWACKEDVLYQKALEAFTHEHLDDAIKLSTKVIKKHPRCADAYQLRGSAYLEKKSYDQALSDFNNTLKLNPKDVMAYTGRAKVYENRDQLEKAIGDYTSAIYIAQNDTHLRYLRGIAYQRNNSYQKAWLDFAIASYLEPDNQRYKILRDEVKTAAIREKDSRNRSRKYRFKEEAKVKRYRAYIAYQGGYFYRAKTIWEDIIANEYPGSFEVKQTLDEATRCYIKDKILAQAETLYIMALVIAEESLMPNDVSIANLYKMYSEYLKKLGRYEDAQKMSIKARPIGVK